MTKAWLDQITRGLAAAGVIGCVVMYGDIRSMKTEILALHQQKKDDAQDAQIAQLWKSEVHQFNNLNDFCKRTRMPDYPWPEDLK